MSVSAITETPLDLPAAQAFGDHVGGIINSGAIAVMLSVGHRAGLFDTLAALPPATSARIAERAGLAERYVREWLAVMVTGGIVRFDPQEKTYRLPAEHAASLTRGAALGNLAVYAQFVPMAGAVQERILECFESGDGLGYGDYPCFHSIMAEDSEQTVVAGLFSRVMPLVPGLEARLEAGIDVLDAGCGAGRVLVALAQRYPNSRFTGIDLCDDAIGQGRRAASEQGLDNLFFEARDLTGFQRPQSFDLITSFDALHDQKDPQGLIAGLHDALRPGGVYLVQDIGGSARLENNLEFPFAAFLYTASCTHCTPVSLGQGGPGLGTMWGWETAQSMLRTAGFENLERHVLEHDPMNVWFVARR